MCIRDSHGVGAQVIHERAVHGDLLSVDGKLLGDEAVSYTHLMAGIYEVLADRAGKEE